MSTADNLHRVQERIARAAESAGRKPDEITLVGVTKYVGAREAAELVAAGCADLGESRAQELWKKHDAFQRAAGFTPAAQPIHWHLIGHLQRNKVARTLPLVTLIHSVDSERLIATINEAAREGEAPAEPHAVARQEPRPPVRILLEVNTSGEAAKHGLAPVEVAPLLESMPKYSGVQVLGLMTMAALEGGEEVASRNFAALRDLRDKLKNNDYANTELDELSMGMSDDFEVAIKEGATIVRVGSLLWKQ
ncbi:MAG TPA: YggS family pyridoxal phosphate-dependent enzyme [Lacipirellulaceae bacterium]|nr:YggS family pyridoxal phosphate-dependent enzyme [Lacipirellulaceae bacterium]